MKNDIHRLTPFNFGILMLIACLGYLFALGCATEAFTAPDWFTKFKFGGAGLISLIIATFILISIWQELYKKPKPPHHP